MKTPTDRYWSERAKTVAEDAEVNILDVFQRDLEYDFVCKRLRMEMVALETGCGNGFSTRKFSEFVKHVDAFDYSQEMINRARSGAGEKNIRFFKDNVLNPTAISGSYDAVICIRVLINLRDLEEQKKALSNLSHFTKQGGVLILVEGFRDGFKSLDELRLKVGLPPLEPAKINFYSWISDLLPTLKETFTVEETFHLGAYDYLTRVVYPLMVGADKAKHNTVFSERCASLARTYNPVAFERFSRVRGFVCRKRSF